MTASHGGGIVVADDRIAAAVGARVLRSGGNAVDAAVATAFAMAVTYPQAMNPGGGGFAVVALPDGETAALDFRERAPAAATPDLFLRPDGSVDRERTLRSALAAGVPGMPAGLAALHRRFGRLAWADLLAPAVDLARDGFPIPQGLADALNDHRKRFAAHDGARAIFVHPDRAWRAGDILRQSDLARTLAAIRTGGADAFQRGEIARAIAREVSAGGGILTAEDIAAYEPIWREPARFAFLGREVVTMPLPSSGGVALRQILGIFEAARGADPDLDPADRLHIFIEAERRAFADRNTFLGDPDGVSGDLVERLTGSAYIRARAATIDRARSTPSSGIIPGEAGIGSESDATSNLCVIDRAGGVAVVTITLNDSFGSRIVARGTGILLNNEMDDFTAKPGSPNLFGLRQGEANAIRPGRRMLSSMSPAIVREGGRPVLAVGAAGGPRILSAVALVIARAIGERMPLDRAVLLARVHHQHLPDEVVLEDASVVGPALAGKGHRIRTRPQRIGLVTAIGADPNSEGSIGVADPRGYGAAVAE